ncbi:PE family protein [Mycobacterium intermedium]|uniref:PE family protein n=1 Tax=Mycobacterium intermedium TaxID=28445 RepID=A0A1E3SDZ1_MYCIE|nr:PE family protein [Mycobacterium intermedium]ODQ99787.1 hypothetical protein BHQ20_15965 [Mycobacterium intermedium]OPE48523.1 PE family protein [Mycobacterium intermedium]ORA94554.1 PE family protein [Mycobacterium intermedium]
MSFLLTQPGLLTGAATDLAGIGSSLDAATAAAAVPTTAVSAAGADEISAAVAAIFQAHGQLYQSVSAQAAAVHAQFVQAMEGAGQAYARAEADNVRLQA